MTTGKKNLPTPPANVSSADTPNPNPAKAYSRAWKDDQGLVHTCRYVGKGMSHTDNTQTHNQYSTVQTCSICINLLHTVISLPEHHGQGWKLSLYWGSKRLLLPSSESRAMILPAVSASNTGGTLSPGGGVSSVISLTSTESSISTISPFAIPAS